MTAPFSFRGERIVCFSTADWDTLLPTNKHQLMTRLAARGAQVLYLETLGTRAPRLAGGVDVARILRRLQRGLEGPRRRAPRLWTLSPMVRPAWSTTPQIELNRFLFARQIAPLTARFGGGIAWVYNPYAVHLLEAIKPSRVVYHMVDDLAAVPGADAEALREAELLMLSRADAVFCTEQSLHDRARRIARRAWFMPNVADYRHFAVAGEPGEQCAARFESLRALPHPRIVFSGNLAPHKVDLALLARLARRRPQWQWVLIGPRWEGAAPTPALRALESLPNVTFTGHVPYQNLPAFLHEADAMVIPYVDNDATRAVFPLKFFEYMATGRPVVASPLPSLLAYHEFVRLAETPDEWLQALEQCLDEPPHRRLQRRTLARRHTWERRLDSMEKALGQGV